MVDQRVWSRHEDDQTAADRQTASLAALALVLCLVLAGLVLVRVLGASCKIEDCLMAGRHDCDAIAARLPLRP